MAVILLADDDVVLRDMYSMRLARERHVVHYATNGQEVIEQAETVRPDIILLDIMMPKMNGLDALKILKTGETTKHIPVIIMTALANDTSQFNTEIQANDYISKSELGPDEIVRRVSSLLTQKEQKWLVRKNKIV